MEEDRTKEYANNRKEDTIEMIGFGRNNSISGRVKKEGDEWHRVVPLELAGQFRRCEWQRHARVTRQCNREECDFQ